MTQCRICLDEFQFPYATSPGLDIPGWAQVEQHHSLVAFSGGRHDDPFCYPCANAVVQTIQQTVRASTKIEGQSGCVMCGTHNSASLGLDFFIRLMGLVGRGAHYICRQCGDGVKDLTLDLIKEMTSRYSALATATKRRDQKNP